jgi:hypothetical protein
MSDPNPRVAFLIGAIDISAVVPSLRPPIDPAIGLALGRPSTGGRSLVVPTAGWDGPPPPSSAALGGCVPRLTSTPARPWARFSESGSADRGAVDRVLVPESALGQVGCDCP